MYTHSYSTAIYIMSWYCIYEVSWELRHMLSVRYTADACNSCCWWFSGIYPAGCCALHLQQVEARYMLFLHSNLAIVCQAGCPTHSLCFAVCHWSWRQILWRSHSRCNIFWWRPFWQTGFSSKRRGICLNPLHILCYCHRWHSVNLWLDGRRSVITIMIANTASILQLQSQSQWLFLQWHLLQPMLMAFQC